MDFGGEDLQQEAIVGLSQQRDQLGVVLLEVMAGGGGVLVQLIGDDLRHRRAGGAGGGGHGATREEIRAVLELAECWPGREEHKYM